MAVGTFTGVGRSLEKAIERTRRAEELGYAAAYVTHIAGRDSLTVLAGYACRTGRIRLGTGVLPIYSRTPASTAQTAATVDELSGGRMVLGLGVSHRATVEPWYGQTIDRPVREMSEYVRAVRAILRGEEPPQDNEKFQTSFRFMGYEARPDLPLYIAALSPAMLRLAGELAAIGSPDEAEGSVRRYLDAGATSPCLGGIPGTDFDAALERLAHLTG